MKWNLIETAPTTGKQILVGFKGIYEWYSYVANAKGIHTGFEMSFHRPTHWTHIEPPKL